MNKAVIAISIISVLVGTGIAIAAVHLLVTPHVPEHYILHCVEPSMQFIPHMKWNCFYLTR
jgi:hypothetical protein